MLDRRHVPARMSGAAVHNTEASQVHGERPGRIEALHHLLRLVNVALINILNV